MPINFIQNDPLDTTFVVKSVAAKHDRPSTLAGFTVAGSEPATKYAPGTAGFVRWQSRQAGLMAVAAWEKVLGSHLQSWQSSVPDPQHLALVPDAGDDINAYYNRQSVSFFHHTMPDGTVVFSGASTDVVAHEVGHGILDALRPDLWSVNFIEVGGFHEAFGDVTAIVTALASRSTRVALLAASADLSQTNFVEATAEELSHAIGIVVGPNHNAAKPRHAVNTFQWQLPQTMPKNGGPDVMIGEVHSIARIMSGCFWDTLKLVFAAGASHTEAALWSATRTVGKLFYRASAAAVVTPRFFQAVGRAMVLVDDQTHAGAHRAQIGQAFADHNIQLGSSAMFSPEAILPGAAPSVGATGAVSVGRTTEQEIRRRLNLVRGTRSMVATDELRGGVARVNYQTPVTLDEVDPRLAGVVADADISVLVGDSGGHAAVLGMTPVLDDHAAEVRAFVGSLVVHGQVNTATAPRRSMAMAGADAAPAEGAPGVTHVVVTSGRVRSLQRVAFACGCSGGTGG